MAVAVRSDGDSDRRDLLARAAAQLRDARVRLAAAERGERTPAAIVGVGIRLPAGTDDPLALWRVACDGTDLVGPLLDSSDGRRRPGLSRVGDRSAALLDDVDEFDAGFFGISSAEATQMDPQQRVALEVAWEAIEDAGLPLEALQRRTTGVYLGIYGIDYLALQLAAPRRIDAYSATGGAHSVAANRISYLLDLKGPSIAVDTACSSGLVALHTACRALEAGDCDIAIAGAVNLVLSPLSTLVTERALPLAPGGRCRPFDAAADGIVRGEACGMVVLERAPDAARAGGRVRAEVAGSAVNQDGRTNGLTAPSPRAQRAVIEAALRSAGADPADVAYVEAHGTGTQLGDPIEAEALAAIYGSGPGACQLGSVKANLGHTEAAAGIVGLIKAMLVLEHGSAPPQAQFARLNPEIDLADTRLTVPTELTPLSGGSRPRLAAVSSFGFGGTNAHAILREVTQATAMAGAPDPELLTLPVSARSDDALADLAARYASRLERCDRREAADVCAAAALGRTHHRHRLCVSAADVRGVVRNLHGRARRHGAPSPDRDPRIAFVFSGQGSQWAGMGAEIMEREPVVREEVTACDAVVRELAGWSIAEQLRAPEHASRLAETEVAQISIAALQLGLVALWRTWGVAPHAVVGHSMGEIVAACVAGCVSRGDALELLLRRSRIAERAARGGAMASIGLPEADVERLLADVDGRVAIAAVNGPEAVVVSGEPAAVDGAIRAARAHGAKVHGLPVEYAFHSDLLDGCEPEMERAADDVEIDKGDLAMYSSVTGRRIRAGELGARHWARNLREPVRFWDALRALFDDGPVACVEVSPDLVLLAELRRECATNDNGVVAVASLTRKQPAGLALRQSLASLYEAGLDVRWDRVIERRHPAALPAYPWQRRRHWLDDPAGAAGPAPEVASSRSSLELSVADLRSAAGSRRQELLVDMVRASLAEALALDDPTEIAPDTPLDALDIDSVAVVGLRSTLELELELAVPLRALLESRTPADVAAVLAAIMEDEEPAAAAAAAGSRSRAV